LRHHMLGRRVAPFMSASAAASGADCKHGRVCWRPVNRFGCRDPCRSADGAAAEPRCSRMVRAISSCLVRRRSGVLVMAASMPAAPDRKRAETYLRLLAEAELRRALAMPEYKSPRERMPAAVAALSVQRRMRRRRATVQRIMQQRAVSPASTQSQPTASSGSAQPIAALPTVRRVAVSVATAREIAAPLAAAVLKAATSARYQLSARGATWPVRRQLRRQFLRHHA
jgi:hypothetical protein